MSFSIDTFRGSALAAGGARANLFEVGITGSAVQKFSLNTTEFNFSCKAAAIPPMAVGVVEVPYFGRMVKVPGNRTFDNLSITVINDEEMEIRNGFEKWMDMFNAHEGNDSLFTGASHGLGTMVITHHTRDFNSSGDQKWEFTNIFPVALGEIGLDWGSNDTIEEFTVDLAYDYWTSEFVE